MKLDAILKALSLIYSARAGREVRVSARYEVQGDISEH